MLASLRLNLSRRLRRPGHLFLGNARVKPLQKSARRVADRFQFRSSLVARELHSQFSTGAAVAWAENFSLGNAK